MGRVRTKTIKKAAYNLIENYASFLSHDFDTNKRFISEVSEIQTKSLRNKIAGFATHLAKKRLHNEGPIRGASNDFQDDEDLRHKDMPTISVESSLAEQETMEMLNNLLGHIKQ